MAKGSGTKQSPWQLTTPSGSSEYQMYKDESVSPPALVCTVGQTELRYQARARRLHRADRRDDRGGAAREDFGEGAVGTARLPLFDADATFLDLITEVFAERQQGVSSDAWQQGAGEVRGQQSRPGSAAEDEEEVHATHLLNPVVLDRIEPDDLVAALLGRLRLRQQAACIVAACLGLAGSARRGPDEVLRQPYGDRLDAGGKVRSGGRGDEHERDLIRRRHGEVDLARVHERPEVEAVLDLDWHPVGVQTHDEVDGLDEGRFRELGQRQPAS